MRFCQRQSIPQLYIKYLHCTLVLTYTVLVCAPVLPGLGGLPSRRLAGGVWVNRRFRARTQTVCLIGTGLAQTKRSSGTGDQSLADWQGPVRGTRTGPQSGRRRVT